MTFESREQLEKWLAETAPADSPDVARTAFFALRELESGTAPHNVLDILRRHWHSRAPAITDDDLWDVLEAAVEAAKRKAAEAKQQALERRLAAARRATAARAKERAAEDRKREAAEQHTERVKKLAGALQLSTRQAQRLLREGTKESRRAEQMAEILGGDPTRYLEPRAKPGRQADLAAFMMRARAAGLTFQDFAADDVELQGQAKIALWSMSEELADDYRDFEEFLSVARRRSIDADVAHRVWLAFVLWRIAAVADRAEQGVKAKIAALEDFG